MMKESIYILEEYSMKILNFIHDNMVLLIE